jgi:dTDP-4-amino-4,6-dideoxygalactose transaminase
MNQRASAALGCPGCESEPSASLTSAIPRAYPKPRVPILPILSWPALAGNRGSGVPSVLEAGSAVRVASGAGAIALALELAGVRAGDRVLVPAYHCPSMVEPVRSLSATPVFFRIRPDTSPDLDDARSKSSGAKAILAVHYFGFPLDLPALRSWCDAEGLILIEDCAHAFFGRSAGRALGSGGDYAIASARKFFPIRDGGLLISSRRGLAEAALGLSRGDSAWRAGLDIVEEASAFGRLAPIGHALKAGFWLKRSLRALLARRRGADPAGPPPPGAAAPAYFDPATTRRRMSGPSRWVLDHASRRRVVRRRRENYARLFEALATLPRSRPLFPELPEDVVPYMFPLWIADPDRVFPRLKLEGVPIWRWEHIEASDCGVSREYSRHLLQLPCHQELTGRELEWMAGRVRAALAGDLAPEPRRRLDPAADKENQTSPAARPAEGE